MRQFLAVSLCAGLLVTGGPVAAAGEPPALAPHVPGQVVVAYSSGVAGTVGTRAKDLGLRVLRRSPSLGVSLMAIPTSTSVAAIAEELSRQPGVAYAEPNYLVSAQIEPNDPSYPYQWPLGDGPGSISAPQAWTVTDGSPAVRIAIVDTGVQLDHPDLAPNLWTNPGEVPNNLIDDDSNGYVDDVHGFDWADVDNDPSDEQGHGTHVAGVAGARGNDGHGVAGTAWDSRIVPLRALDENGIGTTFELAQAFSYAASFRIRVVNASLGGSGYSLTLEKAIADAPGTLFVVSSGNGGSDGIGDNNDAKASYPCSFELPNILCVAASDQNDSLARFSNYGASSVDLAAPGVDVLSTLNGSGYALASGTSMATPFVAGTAALLWSVAPDATVAAVRDAILTGAVPSEGLAGVTASGARLDAFGALTALAPKLVGDNEPEPEPEAEPEPAPEPTEPGLDSGFDYVQRSSKYVVDGWITPVQRGAATIKVVLKKKMSGKFRKVARRDPLLDSHGDTSVYTVRLPRPDRGRCRIIATFVDDDGSRTRSRKTFSC